MSETREPTYAEMKAILRGATLRLMSAIDDLPPPVTEKEKRDYARMLTSMDGLVHRLFGTPAGSA